jgi:hypothetical protein
VTGKLFVLFLSAAVPSAARSQELAEAFLQASAAVPVRAGGAPCYRLSRVVVWKPMGAPDAAYKVYGDWATYVSTAMAGAIDQDVTPWSTRVRAFRLTMEDLVPTERALFCTLAYEELTFPLDDGDHEVWRREQAVKAGEPFVFKVTAPEPADPRDFKVTMTWGPAPDPRLCAIPGIHRR